MFLLAIKPGMVLLGHKLCICSILIDLTNFQRSHSNLFSHKQNMRVLASLHFYQQLVLSMLPILVIVEGEWGRFYHGSMQTIRLSTFSCLQVI